MAAGAKTRAVKLWPGPKLPTAQVIRLYWHENTGNNLYNGMEIMRKFYINFKGDMTSELQL